MKVVHHTLTKTRDGSLLQVRRDLVFLRATDQFDLDQDQPLFFFPRRFQEAHNTRQVSTWVFRELSQRERCTTHETGIVIPSTMPIRKPPGTFDYVAHDDFKVCAVAQQRGLNTTWDHYQDDQDPGLS